MDSKTGHVSLDKRRGTGRWVAILATLLLVPACLFLSSCGDDDEGGGGSAGSGGTGGTGGTGGGGGIGGTGGAGGGGGIGGSGGGGAPPGEVDLNAAYTDGATEDTVGVVLVEGFDDVAGEDFGTAKYRMRPVILYVGGDPTDGTVALSASTSEIVVYRTDGTPEGLPASFAAADLPVDLLVGATATTDGTLTAEYTPTSGSPSTDVVRVSTKAWPGLSGRPLGAFPHFEFVDNINEDESAWAAIDPTRFPDRVGFAYDVYIVAHKTPAEWAADNALSDVTGGADTATAAAGSIADNDTEAWSSGLDGGTMLGQPYDVVLDFGQDGTLDPGDMIDGLYSDRAGMYVIRDITTDGAYATSQNSYSVGGYAQRTYYPSDIASMGQLPLVIICHGNGHQYTWYNYLQRHLASHGYVAMAHQGNPGGGISAHATTLLDNTDNFLGALGSIAGGVLDGHVDGSKISWIGHSRGGEAVAMAYDRLYEGYSVDNYDADDIVYISSIAPTVFEPVGSLDVRDRNYNQMLGAADGDVCGAPITGLTQWFRIMQRGTGNRSFNYVHGAAHNDFNENPSGGWDATGPDLIGQQETYRVAKSYYLAMIDWYVKGNPAGREFLTRNFRSYHASGIASHVIVANAYRDDVARGNYFIDDYQTDDGTGTASSGATVTFSVENVVERGLDDANGTLAWMAGDPMNGMTHNNGGSDTARGVVFDFQAEAFYEYAVPAGDRDFSGYEYLSLWACQGTRHPYTVALDDYLDFSVTLEDGSGTTSSINIAQYGALTPLYQRSYCWDPGDSGSGLGWVNEFNTMRIRLLDFETDGSGINLRDIAVVRLQFGGSFGSGQGRIGLDDVELTL